MTVVSDTDDQKALQAALSRIKEICKGNGVKPESIAILSQTMGVHTLKAQTTVTLRPQIQEKSTPGRGGAGERTPNREDAMRRIEQSAAAGSQGTGALNAQIAGILLSRVDRGFGLSQQTIPLDGHKKDYYYEESCAACSGSGRLSCPKCYGQKYETCPRCAGRGVIPCSSCHGTGMVGGNTCQNCRGQRTVRCPDCHGSGRIICRTCQGSGSIACPSCHGQGVRTTSLTVTMAGVADFSYDAKSIPHGAAHMIDTHGGRLAETQKIRLDGHPIKDDAGTLGVSYDISFPYADVIFQINGKTFPAGIFGYDADLVNFPPILDKLILRGIGLLEEAAQKRGDAAALIREAAQYRIIRTALSLLLKTSAKKALPPLVKKFSPGLSPQGAHTVLTLLVKALAHITLRPRLYGFALGAGITAALMGALYLTPLRGDLGRALPPLPVDGVIEAGLLIAGGFIIQACVYGFAAQAVQSILGLGGQKKGGRPQSLEIPGTTRWSFALAGVILLAFLFARPLMALPNPIWVDALKGFIGLS